MSLQCKLCGRRIPDRSGERSCECGWRLDARCHDNHHGFCPSHGDDRWVGALER